MSLGLLLDMAAAEFGDRVALGSPATGTTYDRMAKLAAGGAAVLRERGAGTLAFVGVNSPAMPTLLFTASAAGIPFAPLNYRLGREQLRRLIDRLDRPVVVADSAYTEILRGAGVATVESQAWVDQAGRLADTTPPMTTGADDSQPAVLLFTSGTTAEPKCVVLRHAHLLSYILTTVEFGGAGPEESALVTVPPYHIAAVASALSNVYAGRRVVHLPDFSPGAWLNTVRGQGITRAMVVPTMLARIVSHLDGAGAGCPRLKSLAYGGARMPAPVLAEALRAFPDTDFSNAYGLTETSSTLAVLAPDDHRRAIDAEDPGVRARLSSVGRPVPGIETQIRGAEGRTLPPYEAGELWVRGEQVSGEYRDEGSALDEDGWFPTRDQAYVDDDGYLFLVGRADDTIIRGGENISPAEVEDVLLEHPAVREAAVLGVPDDEWGELLVAVLVPADVKAAPDPQEVREFVRSRIRSSRTPDRIVLRDELPQTATGKVLRRQLVADLMESASVRPVTSQGVER